MRGRPADFRSDLLAHVLPGARPSRSDVDKSRASSLSRAPEGCNATVAQLAQPHPLAVHGIVTVSIGVTAAAPTRHDDPTTFVELADMALYWAKEGGRNRVETAFPPTTALPTPHPG